MQSQIGSPVPMRHGESIYAGITRWAARAERHLLEVMFWSGSLGSLAIAVIDTGHFLIATPMITLASIGGWGLAERDRRQHASRLSQFLEATFLVLGCLSAIVGSFALLIWIMGPAPIL